MYLRPVFQSILALALCLAGASPARAEAGEAELSRVSSLRQSLGDACRRGDSAAIAAVLVAGGNITAGQAFLWPGEKALSRILARRFDALDSVYGFHTVDSTERTDPPGNDELYEDMVDQVEQRYGEFTGEAVRKFLGDERADFLEILVLWYLGHRHAGGWERLIRQCLVFREVHPDSPYIAFLQDIMGESPQSPRPVFMGMGVTYDRFLGSAGRRIPSAWMLDFDLGAARERHHFMLGIGLGVMLVKEGLRGTHRTLKPDGADFTSRYSLRYGYALTGGKTVVLPYAGYSMRTFSQWDDPLLFGFLAGVQILRIHLQLRGLFTYQSLELGGVYQYGDLQLRDRLQGPAFTAKASIGLGG